MIPLVDVSVVDRVNSVFPTIPMAWIPSKNGRKAAYVALNINPGESGITVYRTNISNHNKGTQLPFATEGARFATAVDKKTAKMETRFQVTATYEIVLWTYSQKTLNDLNRTLMFSPIYKPLQVTYNSNIYPFTVLFKDPRYLYESDDDLETVRYYGLNYTFEIDTFWLQEYDVSLVNTVLINYYDQITSGNLIDTLSIVPNP